MKIEEEITVLVNTSYEDLHRQLSEKGFKIIDKYVLQDRYMINSEENMGLLKSLDILKKCVLVRNIFGRKKSILFKDKKYAPNGDIISQSKIECEIDDIDKAILFMNAINYQILFIITDECTVYSDGKTEIIVQFVNDKYVFIEMESDSNTSNGNLSVNKMKEILDSYDLPYDRKNYFVKKAEIILEEMRITTKI